MWNTSVFLTEKETMRRMVYTPVLSCHPPRAIIYGDFLGCRWPLAFTGLYKVIMILQQYQYAFGSHQSITGESPIIRGADT
jgi:hypothetical protein